MNASTDNAYQMTDNGKNAKECMSIWSEEDIEELQEETPWEIFSSEIDNWAAINLQAAEL